MKNLLKKVLIIMLSLVLISPTIKPRAELQGGKWTTTIKIYCYSSVTPDMKSSISTAINSWNSRLKSIGSNISIRDLYSSQKSEANVIVTVKNYTGAVALTTNYPSKTSSIYTGAKIEYNQNLFESLTTTSERVNSASHELGHVLGLDHTTTSSASVMKYYIQSDTPLPTAFDLAELDKIY